MTLYFFHFVDGDIREEDDTGIEYATAENAYLEAIASVRGMWPDMAADRCDPSRCAFEIADEGGEILFRIDFSEVLSGGKQSTLGPVGSTGRLSQILHETHLRATTARNGMASSLNEVRKSLEENAQLLSQLDRYGQHRAAE